MVYAVFSCAHFANGYFHAYDVASTIKDLDFWYVTSSQFKGYDVTCFLILFLCFRFVRIHVGE